MSGRLFRILGAIAALAINFFWSNACYATPDAVSSVADIAAMQALGATSSQYPVLLVRGYQNEGDGGGGTFRWDGGSTATADGGTVFQATGVATGRWVRTWSGAVHSAWFGVLAARADNTSYAQALIDFENANKTGVILDGCDPCTFTGTINFLPLTGRGDLGASYVADGYAHWQYTGTSVGFKAEATSNLDYRYNFQLAGIHLECASTAVVCFEANGIGQGSNLDLDVWGSSHTNVKLSFIIAARIRLIVSGNIHSPPQAAVGVDFDINDDRAGVQDNSIFLICEVMVDCVTGKKVRSNTFFGTVEGNTGTGASFDIESTWNVFSGVDMEANATADLILHGSNNVINGGLYGDLLNIDQTNTVQGAEVGTLSISANSEQTVLNDLLIDTSFSNSGTDTQWSGLKLPGTPSSYQPPKTGTRNGGTVELIAEGGGAATCSNNPASFSINGDIVTIMSLRLSSCTTSGMTGNVYVQLPKPATKSGALAVAFMIGVTFTNSGYSSLGLQVQAGSDKAYLTESGSSGARYLQASEINVPMFDLIASGTYQ